MSTNTTKNVYTRYPLKRHEDRRGWLVQSDYPQIFSQAKHFLVSYSHPGVIRGNHYHKRKKDWFYVISGEAEFHLEDTKTKTRVKIHARADHPEYIEVKPYVAHTIRNSGSKPLVFLEFVTEPYDPNDDDTYAYVLDIA